MEDDHTWTNLIHFDTILYNLNTFQYLGLSKPFRQLEKYASVSLELEQHMEDDHTDRGDCQRSIGYYKNVAAECATHRRQKELELEIMTGKFNFFEQQREKSIAAH